MNTLRRGTARLFALSLLLSACGGGPGRTAKPVLDPDSQKFFATARLVMSSEEADIFTHLPDAASRREFIADFWAKRDPDPDTPDNEFKATFESRVEYANKRFKEGGPGYNTDRGRIYIFMGPPDKTDEVFSHMDPEIRGQIIWWVYYAYELGIEFIDERGDGTFRIRRYTGNFFEAIDLMRLGQGVSPDGAFRRSAVNFKAGYDAVKEEIKVLLPADGLAFRDGERGVQVDLEFRIDIYEDRGARKDATLRETRTYATTDAELLEIKEIPFVFARRLPRGTNYADIIVKGAAGTTGKVRKLFRLKVQ